MAQALRRPTAGNVAINDPLGLLAQYAAAGFNSSGDHGAGALFTFAKQFSSLSEHLFLSRPAA